MRKGHEFEMKLEDEIPPIRRSLYKMSPRELQEAKDQIQLMLKHDLIRPLDSPYGSSFYLSLKKTAAVGSTLITVD